MTELDATLPPAASASFPGRWAGRIRKTLQAIFGDPVFRQKLRFLHSVVLFKDVSTRDLARLVKKIMEKTYGPGDIVFQEGDLGRAFFIIAEGRVEILRRSSNAAPPEVVAHFGPGDFLGEMVLLDELPRSATCRAVETSRLYVLYKDVFDHLRVHSPKAAAPMLHALGRLLSARLRREQRSALRIPMPPPKTSGA